MKDYKENLKSGEELFFISASQISTISWVRCPVEKKTDAIRIFTEMMSDPDFEEVQIYSEKRLSDRVSLFDESVGEWKDSHYTYREQLFGAQYQYFWEFFNEKVGLNLDEIEKVQSDRANYEKQLKQKFPEKYAA